VTTRDGFDRDITAWLVTSAGTAAPEYLDETLESIGNLAQRPAWAFPRRWLPLPSVGPRSVPVLVALLLIALLIGLGVVGGKLRLPRQIPTVFPPPYGLAATGFLAFDSDGQIVLANPDGSGVRVLHPSGRPVSDSHQYGATFSRDGARVAYWEEYGWKLVHGVSTQKAAHLWVVDVDGANAVNLTPDLEVAPWSGQPAGSWSPDGKSIVFTSDKEAPMYVVATDGRTPPRAIGDGFLLPQWPAWSPDGSRIAFVGMERLPDSVLGTPMVHVINADGTGQAQVSPSARDGMSGLPQWSPDGQQLVYTVDTAPPPPQGEAPAELYPSTFQVVTASETAAGWTERVVVPAERNWYAAFSNATCSSSAWTARVSG
jgi:hypothetical protein